MARPTPSWSASTGWRPTARWPTRSAPTAWRSPRGRPGCPFVAAGPTSSVDLATPDGAAIPIEERDPDEVRRAGGALVTPPGVRVRNPAFDVTPPELVDAIVTERGVARPPLGRALAALLAG